MGQSRTAAITVFNPRDFGAPIDDAGHLLGGYETTQVVPDGTTNALLAANLLVEPDPGPKADADTPAKTRGTAAKES